MTKGTARQTRLQPTNPSSQANPIITPCHPSKPKKVKKQATNHEVKAGRWKNHEAVLFLRAYCENANDWNKISQQVGSRTVSQVRSYAQKAFARMKEARQMRRNLEHANDKRYSVHNRSVPNEVIQLDGPSRRSRLKKLKRQTRLSDLEQRALQLYQLAQTQREERRLKRLAQQPLQEQKESVEPLWFAWRTYRVIEAQQVQRQLRGRQSRQFQVQQNHPAVNYTSRLEAVTIIKK